MVQVIIPHSQENNPGFAHFDGAFTVVAVPDHTSMHRLTVTHPEAPQLFIGAISVKREEGSVASISNLFVNENIDHALGGAYLLQQAVAYARLLLNNYGELTSNVNDDNEEGRRRHVQAGFVPNGASRRGQTQFVLRFGGYGQPDDMWDDDDDDDDDMVWDDIDDIEQTAPPQDDGLFNPDGDDPFDVR